MAILVGIDEAGYGPLLGPLVVSAAAMRLPDEDLKSDMWQMLKGAVSINKKNLNGRILIADSKKAYSKKAGIDHLQRTVLTVLKYLGQDADNVLSLLNKLCPNCLERIVKYPWYENIAEQKLGQNNDAISLCACVLSKELKRASVDFLSIKSICLDVGYYNKMVNLVQNKATVLFTSICTLIQQYFDEFGSENLQIIVDRQGGRADYRGPLLSMFNGAELKVLRQDENLSSYHLSLGDKQMKIHFAVKADSKYLPVCLASMASKYIRELLIEQMNKYFIAHCAELVPTAGYWTDGTRFIEDLAKFCPNIKYDSELLIRCR